LNPRTSLEVSTVQKRMRNFPQTDLENLWKKFFMLCRNSSDAIKIYKNML